MTRFTAVTIILLSAVLSGCATTTRNDSHSLPMLLGSLSAIETEAAHQLSRDSSPETFRALIGIFDVTVNDLRRAKLPSEFPQVPCRIGIHCPDSKCGGFNGDFCTGFINRYVERSPKPDLSWEYLRSLHILETEVLLRFGHVPNEAMAKYLIGRLEQTYREMRKRDE